MKIYHLPFLFAVVTWLSVGQIVAQTQPTVEDSVSQGQNSPARVTSGFGNTPFRYAVKAGDSVKVTAQAFEGQRVRGRFWKSLAKAIVPGFFVYKLTTQPVGGEGTAIASPGIGVGLSVVPGAVELVAFTKKRIKPFLGLVAYDSNGKKVASLKQTAVKKAQGGWKDLELAYKVKKDGFVESKSWKINKLFGGIVQPPLQTNYVSQIQRVVTCAEAIDLGYCTIYISCEIDGTGGSGPVTIIYQNGQYTIFNQLPVVTVTAPGSDPFSSNIPSIPVLVYVPDITFGMYGITSLTDLGLIHLPGTIYTESGDVTVLFGTTKDKKSSDQPICSYLLEGLYQVVQEMNRQGYGVTSISISATTNGEHADGSYHYDAAAIDINQINGERIQRLGPNDPRVQAMQNFFQGFQSMFWNFIRPAC